MVRGSTAVEVVINWFDEQLKVGRFRQGDPFPTEREISQRLRVSRSAAREAKSFLCGQGVIQPSGSRVLVSRRNSPDMLREWIRATTTGVGRERLPKIREALEFRRFALSEIIPVAIQRARPTDRADLQHTVRELYSEIALRLPALDVAQRHNELIICATRITDHRGLISLGWAVIESLWSLPVWNATIAHYKEWTPFLDELANLVEQRKPAAARGLLRKRLQILDAQLHDWLSDPRMPERLEPTRLG